MSSFFAKPVVPFGFMRSGRALSDGFLGAASWARHSWEPCSQPVCVGVGEAPLSARGAQPQVCAHRALFDFPRLIILELGARTLVVRHGPQRNFE